MLLITGGSRGIGAATARLAAHEGYAVAVNYRQQRAAADNVVAEIAGNGGRACAVQGDISKDDDVRGMFAEVERQLDPITHLVNNAGVDGGGTAVSTLTADALQGLFAVNVVGLMLCCREAVRRMSTRHGGGGGGGAIVNVSSMAATIGGRPGAADYAASKAAVDAFTVGLAKEVARDDIRVNAVRPGMTSTDMTSNLSDDPELGSRIAATIPMHRMASADEIARPILWLLSDAASFVSGACLDVSGGGFVIGDPLEQ